MTPHKLFKRDGINLYMDMPISFAQAALGAELEIPTLEEKIQQKIPEGTQTDTNFRIKGKGLPRLRTNVKGDLVVTVRIEVPKRLSDKQKELLREFEEMSTAKDSERQKSFKDKVKDIFQ